MDKVLFPVEFMNPVSKLDSLRKFARKVVLTHIVEIMPLSSHLEVKEDVERRLGGMAERLKETGVETRTVVKIGNPGLKIAEIAEREKADMIVVPVMSGGFFKRLIYGNMANNVLKFSRRPILVVKDGFDDNAFEKPLISLPLEDAEFCLDIMDTLKGIRKMIKTAVFYHAGNGKEELEYYARKLGVPYEVVVEERKKLPEQIVNAAVSTKATSIIVGRKSRFFDDIVMLGTAASVVRRSPLPVLVIPK